MHSMLNQEQKHSIVLWNRKTNKAYKKRENIFTFVLFSFLNSFFPIFLCMISALIPEYGAQAVMAVGFVSPFQLGFMQLGVSFATWCFYSIIKKIRQSRSSIAKIEFNATLSSSVYLSIFMGIILTVFYVVCSYLYMYFSCNRPNTQLTLEYGYNFKPQYITLERDRKSCNNWDAKVITSKMICEAMVKGSLSIKQVGALVIKNADDIYQLDVIDGGNPDKVKRLLIEEFDRQNPTSYSIPVSTQEHADIVRRYGGNPVIVPQTFASAIRQEIDRRIEALISAPMSNGLTLKEKFQRWCDLYGAKAGCIHQEELQNLIDELNWEVLERC